jgi:hypothetical protein
MSFAFKRICLVLTLCLNGALFCSAQKPATYVTFEVPQSTGTFPTSINNQLSVAGYYNGGNGSEGFVRDISGNIETFKVGTLLTQASAINDRGEIAGIYQNVSGEQGGFIRSPKGVITTLTPGGATGLTTPTGITDDGLVTGFYAPNNGGILEPFLGFVRYPDGGIVTFNATTDTTYTTPYGVNLQGATTGAYFYDGNTQVGGFVRDPDGNTITFQYQQGIVPTSINASGTTAGWYGPTSGPVQGFVRSAEGKITPFELPGQIGDSVDTSPSINWAGEVTGSYTVANVPNQPSEPSEITYGFLRSCDGKIVSFKVPGTGVFYTAPSDINDFGVVTGTYFGQSGFKTGFLRIPSLK